MTDKETSIFNKTHAMSVNQSQDAAKHSNTLPPEIMVEVIDDMDNIIPDNNDISNVISENEKLEDISYFEKTINDPGTVKRTSTLLSNIANAQKDRINDPLMEDLETIDDHISPIMPDEQRETTRMNGGETPELVLDDTQTQVIDIENEFPPAAPVDDEILSYTDGENVSLHEVNNAQAVETVHESKNINNISLPSPTTQQIDEPIIPTVESTDDTMENDQKVSTEVEKPSEIMSTRNNVNFQPLVESNKETLQRHIYIYIYIRIWLFLDTKNQIEPILDDADDEGPVESRLPNAKSTHSNVQPTPTVQEQDESIIDIRNTDKFSSQNRALTIASTDEEKLSNLGANDLTLTDVHLTDEPNESMNMKQRITSARIVEEEPDQLDLKQQTDELPAAKEETTDEMRLDSSDYEPSSKTDEETAKDQSEPTSEEKLEDSIAPENDDEDNWAFKPEPKPTPAPEPTANNILLSLPVTSLDDDVPEQPELYRKRAATKEMIVKPKVKRISLFPTKTSLKSLVATDLNDSVSPSGRRNTEHTIVDLSKIMDISACDQTPTAVSKASESVSNSDQTLPAIDNTSNTNSFSEKTEKSAELPTDEITQESETAHDSNSTGTKSAIRKAGRRGQPLSFIENAHIIQITSSKESHMRALPSEKFWRRNQRRVSSMPTEEEIAAAKA